MTLPACPSCGAALTGAPACPSCALPLVGPVAAQLWLLDQRLEGMRQELTRLESDRAALLEQLRTGSAPSVPPGQAVPAGSRPVTTPVFAPAPLPPPAAPQETSPEQVQNTLLGLGAMLLAVAGIVFAAYSYQRLGDVGRALVMLALTGAAGAVPFTLVRRQLTSTSEAIGAVAVVLGVVDVFLVRAAGVGEGLDERTYAAMATAVLAGALGAAAHRLPLAGWQLTAVFFGQLPLLLAASRSEPSLASWAVVLTGLAVLDGAVAVLRPLPELVRRSCVVFGVLALVAAVACSVNALQDGHRTGSFGLVAVAAVLVAAATQVREPAVRPVLCGLPVPLVAGAAWGAAGPELAHDQRPLILLAVALLALQLSGLIPRGLRLGPAVGALLVVATALAFEVPQVLLAVGGPFTWLADPWELQQHSARGAVSSSANWDGSLVTLVVLTASAACLLAGGWLLDVLDRLMAPVVGLVVLTALVLPLALDPGYRAALGMLLAAGAALCAAGTLLPVRWRVPLTGSGLTVLLVAAVWSVAEREATLVVLPLVAVAAIALSSVEPWLLTVGVLLLGGELAATGAANGLSREEAGALLLAAPAVCAGLSAVLRGVPRQAVEVAGAVLVATSVVLTADDAEWLALALAAGGVLCLAVAVRPDRRAAGYAGTALLTASSWVRLIDAQVTAPEPYVVPVGLVALGIGWFRRRADPRMGSFTAYGPGLSLVLVPTLLRSLADASPARGLFLSAACVVGLLVGARWRLRAPLAICGAVLVLDLLRLLAPFAEALPRWVPLTLAGALLVGVGATYEQRRRDLGRLKERYERLA